MASDDAVANVRNRSPGDRRAAGVDVAECDQQLLSAPIQFVDHFVRASAHQVVVAAEVALRPELVRRFEHRLPGAAADASMTRVGVETVGIPAPDGHRGVALPGVFETVDLGQLSPTEAAMQL